MCSNSTVAMVYKCDRIQWIEGTNPLYDNNKKQEEKQLINVGSKQTIPIHIYYMFYCT